MLIDLVFDELVAQADACSSRERFRMVVLEQLGRLAPFDSAVFLPRSTIDRPTTINKTPRHAEIYRHFRVREASYQRDLARAHAAAARDGAYLDSDVYSLAERDRLPFFGDILRPQGITSRLVAHVRFRGQVTATVHLCRHGRAPAFQRSELELVQRTAPILGLTGAALEPRDQSLDRGPLAELSPRERELAHYLRGGYRNKEIATLVGRPPNTVRNQLARIFAKLGVHSRAELAALVERAER
jgi:DNA-binding CsgD family transcriptional regulator